MKIAIGSDERTPVTDAIVAELLRRGHDLVLDMTGGAAEATDPSANSWPAVARAVGEAVANGAADEGILFCWTGTGVSIAASALLGR